MSKHDILNYILYSINVIELRLSFINLILTVDERFVVLNKNIHMQK